MLFGRKISDSDEEFKKLKLHMQTQLNNLKIYLQEFRNQIISANISDEQKQEAFKMLDEAEGYLKSAENNINQNNMREARKNIKNHQKLVDKCCKRVFK
jgi:hypothetical protein